MPQCNKEERATPNSHPPPDPLTACTPSARTAHGRACAGALAALTLQHHSNNWRDTSGASSSHRRDNALVVHVYGAEIIDSLHVAFACIQPRPLNGCERLHTVMLQSPPFNCATEEVLCAKLHARGGDLFVTFPTSHLEARLMMIIGATYISPIWSCTCFNSMLPRDKSDKVKCTVKCRLFS